MLAKTGDNTQKELDNMYENRTKRLFRHKKTPRFREGLFIWQGRRDSNSRHPVLETGALPTELRP